MNVDYCLVCGSHVADDAPSGYCSHECSAAASDYAYHRLDDAEREARAMARREAFLIARHWSKRGKQETHLRFGASDAVGLRKNW